MEWRSSALFMTGPGDLGASYGASYVHKCIATTHIGEIGAIQPFLSFIYDRNSRNHFGGPFSEASMNRKVRTERRERFDEYRAPHGTTNALFQVSGPSS